MPESVDPFTMLLNQDRRYKPAVYLFVFDALTYAHDSLGLGAEKTSEPLDESTGQAEEESSEDAADRPHRHLTGQQLCEAIRLYALEQFGYMARSVFRNWGVTSTSDFGEIVFNLIRIGRMRKTPDDRREDFDNVFDFEAGLDHSFRIELPKEPAGPPE